MDSSCIIPVIVIIAVVIVIWITNRKKATPTSTQSRTRSDARPPSTQRGYPSTSNRTSPYSGPVPSTQKDKYRPPVSSVTKPKIPFRELSNTVAKTNLPGIEDLHDALTGASLNPSLGLYQCSKCKVFYHSESFTALKEINNSACVSCQSKTIFPVTTFADTKFRKEYIPNVVTIDNYRQFAGQVVTFEGYVHTVLESRRGNDFAVMFENKSWILGFKLVFFRDVIREIGGSRFLYSLVGKTIQVRGLIINHETFGYEIMVTEKGMILGVN